MVIEARPLDDALTRPFPVAQEARNEAGNGHMADEGRRRRRDRRDDQDDRLRASDRGRLPHALLPAVLDSVGLDEGHAADRRLPLRQQDGLRLFAAFLPLRALHLLDGRIFGARARTRRRRRLPPPRRTGRTSSSAPIGLPGDRIQVQDGVLYHQRRARAAGPADGVFEEVYERQGAERLACRCARTWPSGMGADCSKDRFLETLPNGRQPRHPRRPRRPARQHGGLHRARRPLLLHGRQPRQLDRQPRDAAGRAWASCPFENLIGRADRVMFSSAGRSLFFFWTWRSDRFFKAIE